MTAELIDLALGRAGAEEVARLEKHIEECRYCKNQYQSQQEAVKWMRELEPAEDESMLAALATMHPDEIESPRPRPGIKQVVRRSVATVQAAYDRTWQVCYDHRVAAAAALLLVVVLPGAGYYVGRDQVIAQVQTLLQQLGLMKPVETEGFMLSARDTLVLDARIDRRSIQKVVFRPLPGEEHVLFQSDQPQEGFESLRALKKYALDGPLVGNRVTPEVSFVPFEDFPADLLPAPEDLTRRREILLTATLGIVLDPSTAGTVRLDLPATITVADKDGVYNLQGAALADGVLYVLVHPVAAGDTRWWVQNRGNGTPVRAGQLFTITSFFTEADEFDVIAMIVPSEKDWPFPPGQTLIESIPPSEHRFGPVRVTVTRPK